MSAIALIDYGAGNLRSVHNALVAAGADDVAVTADPDVVGQADRIVLPGVGAYADCRAGLDAVPGMVEALEERALKGGVPFLGICVGMQLLATVGREFGETPGLGWVAGEVVKLEPGDEALKIPHMGWNELSFTDHPLFRDLTPGAHAYFVHSYHFRPRQPEHRIAHVDYGGMVVAGVARGNIAGVQFHPEKSQETGMRLISSFLAWEP